MTPEQAREASVEAMARAMCAANRTGGMEDIWPLFAPNAEDALDALLAHPEALITLLVEGGALEQVGWRSPRRLYDMDQLALPEQVYARHCVPVYARVKEEK